MGPNVAQFGKLTLHLGRICKAYLTKSGLRVFGFCPAGSTSKVDLTLTKGCWQVWVLGFQFKKTLVFLGRIKTPL